MTRCVLVLSLVAMFCLLVPRRGALGYTPESKDVKDMVTRGRVYLERNFEGATYARELGGVSVCALACYKATGNAQHPLAKKAVARIRHDIQNGLPSKGHANYSLGLALIFLGELDPIGYSSEVEALLDTIYKRQMSNGAWSYPNIPLGDTSQTQYACLGMWMAHRQGIEVRMPVVEKVTNWFLRIQAPDGGFPYQGQDPGTFTRIEQQRKTESMGAAGTGSLYVCGELLGFIDDPRMMQKKLNLPPAIRPVIEKKEEKSAVEQARWLKAVTDGNSWFMRNGKIENHYAGSVSHQYYYMYTVERYWAFRELAEKIDNPEPDWYNRGVEYLKKHQEKDGSWKHENGPAIGTAFAMLFLMRTSKAAVKRLVIEQGRLTGGKGLEGDLSTARVDQTGKVVVAKPEKAVADLINMLDDPDVPQAEIKSDIPDRLVLSEDPKQRALELARLRRLLVNGPYEWRRKVAKAFGKDRDLGNAPVLIFALSDPDYHVARAARDALRFMSRKPEGFGFKIEGQEKPPKHTVERAQKQWTEWLLSVKPDAELLQ